MMEKYYQALELNTAAGLGEIKQAYRRLAKRYHPDTASGGLARFLEVQQAYEALVKAAAAGGENPSPVGNGLAGPGLAAPWSFRGVAEKGLDVVYVLEVDAHALATGLVAALPWKKEGPCPRCLGSGLALDLAGGGEMMVCPRCRGAGLSAANTVISIEIPAGTRAGTQLRLAGRGRYDPVEARRGDLVIQLNSRAAENLAH